MVAETEQYAEGPPICSSLITEEWWASCINASNCLTRRPQSPDSNMPGEMTAGKFEANCKVQEHEQFCIQLNFYFAQRWILTDADESQTQQLSTSFREKGLMFEKNLSEFQSDLYNAKHFGIWQNNNQTEIQISNTAFQIIKKCFANESQMRIMLLMRSASLYTEVFRRLGR